MKLSLVSCEPYTPTKPRFYAPEDVVQAAFADIHIDAHEVWAERFLAALDRHGFEVVRKQEMRK